MCCALTGGDLMARSRVSCEPLPGTFQEKPGITLKSVFKHPCGDIAVPVENAPYVDMVVAFKIKNEVGIMWQRPAPQAGKIQLVGVSG